VGVGYLEAEFRALGAPFEHRGAVADDYLAAMRAIWSQDAPAHKGAFVSFANIQARPQPVQCPHPPIVIGGRTAPAFRRAVAQGQGWYGSRSIPPRPARRWPACAKRRNPSHARLTWSAGNQRDARARRHRRRGHRDGVRRAWRAPADPHAAAEARTRLPSRASSPTLARGSSARSSRFARGGALPTGRRTRGAAESLALARVVELVLDLQGIDRVAAGLAPLTASPEPHTASRPRFGS